MPVASKKSTPVDYEAYFARPLPADVVYMHNVLLSFVNWIPERCYPYCTSANHPVAAAMASVDARQAYLRDFVEERLGKLADAEYRGWINGQQPFVTPRELQIWRLGQFVQYIWFWSIPDDDDLAMIFNLTTRRAANLAADFQARFRKTMIYPVALRRLYDLINTELPIRDKPEPHLKATANGYLYRVPSRRMVEAAGNLVDDIRTELPRARMATPYLADRDLRLMWIDVETVNVMKTNDDLRKRLYGMYKIPGV